MTIHINLINGEVSWAYVTDDQHRQVHDCDTEVQARVWCRKHGHGFTVQTHHVG